ncbi:MAG: transcription termination factor Rho, partial [Firmicutes bacterium]|nr:transcription termination factor Rho [Bacillota bacterium]
LVRAYNYVVPPSGRVLAGGLDPSAFTRPKAFFGSARKLEEGGSVTVVALAGTETLSRTDDFILEEFRGTANMELHLERKVAETGIVNAVRLEKSMTKRDSLLLSAEELAAAKKVRFEAAEHGVTETFEKLKYLISQTPDNTELSKLINKQGI